MGERGLDPFHQPLLCIPKGQTEHQMCSHEAWDKVVSVTTCQTEVQVSLGLSLTCEMGIVLVQT